VYVAVSTRCSDCHIGWLQTFVTLPTSFNRFCWPSVLFVWVNLKGVSFEDVSVELTLNITTATLRYDWLVFVYECMCVYNPSEINNGCSRCVVLLKVPRVDYSHCQKMPAMGCSCRVLWDMYTPVSACAVFTKVKKGVCLVGMFKTNSGCKGMCFNWGCVYWTTFGYNHSHLQIWLISVHVWM